MELIDYGLITLAGLAGGFLAGFLGIGGGIVYVLILPIAFSNYGVPEQHIAQFTIANSIFGVFFAAVSASFTYWLQKEFYLRETLLVSIAGGIGSALGLQLIVKTNWYSQEIFNTILVFILSYLLYSTLSKNRPGGDKEQNPPRDARKYFLLAGFGGGSISALSGLGGGTILIPFLNSLMRLKIHRAKAISLGMIVFTSLVITLMNLFADVQELQISTVGYIIFPMTIPLSAGVILASPIGVKVSKKVSDKTINFIFATFISIVILSKLWEIYIYLL